MSLNENYIFLIQCIYICLHKIHRNVKGGQRLQSLWNFLPVFKSASMKVPLWPQDFCYPQVGFFCLRSQARSVSPICGLVCPVHRLVSSACRLVFLVFGLVVLVCGLGFPVFRLFSPVCRLDFLVYGLVSPIWLLASLRPAMRCILLGPG